MEIKKKGDLRENVPEVIIAVIAILIIVYGAYKIYQITIGQESENAKKMIDDVVGRVSLLQEGQSGKFLIQGFKMKTPLSWFIVGWSKDEIGRPDKCYFDSCVCICKVDDPARAFRFNIGSLGFFKQEVGDKVRVFRDACQKNGFCRKVDVDEVSVGSIINLESKLGVGFYSRWFTSPIQNPKLEVNFVLIPDDINEIELKKEKRDGKSYLKIFQTHVIYVDAKLYPFGIFGFRLEEEK
ncbi:MAG: hypothetical protein N3D20_01430 [Candidatus Pacearchaeota archaeon]|nr:hypothetical protein [Candidatus Pacearchaeota archaeon]